jgi:hypothetical protein
MLTQVNGQTFGNCMSAASNTGLTDTTTLNTVSRLKQIVDLRNGNEFRELSRRYSKKSFLTVLGVSRLENPHSNFLKWLFDDSGSHDLNDVPLRRFLDLIVLVKNGKQSQNPDLEFPPSLEYTIIGGNYKISNISVGREKYLKDFGRIDLIISFDLQAGSEPVRHLNVLVENKVDAGETFKGGIGQTTSYYNWSKRESKNEEWIYVLLSPMSSADFKDLVTPNCQCKHFIAINYQHLLDYVIGPCQSDCKAQEGQIFLGQYIISLAAPTFETGRNVVMATSEDQRKLLRDFWDSNRDLLMAALAALADDPNLDDEDGEAIRDSLALINDASSRDYSKYSLNGAVQANGKGFNKRGIVWEYLQLYLSSNPNATSDDVKSHFPFEAMGANWIIPDSQLATKDAGRYYPSVLHLADGDFSLRNQYGGSMEWLVEVATADGHDIQKLP